MSISLSRTHATRSRTRILYLSHTLYLSLCVFLSRFLSLTVLYLTYFLLRNNNISFDRYAYAKSAIWKNSSCTKNCFWISLSSLLLRFFVYLSSFFFAKIFSVFFPFVRYSLANITKFYADEEGREVIGVGQEGVTGENGDWRLGEVLKYSGQSRWYYLFFFCLSIMIQIARTSSFNMFFLC